MVLCFVLLRACDAAGWLVAGGVLFVILCWMRLLDWRVYCGDCVINNVV